MVSEGAIDKQTTDSSPCQGVIQYVREERRGSRGSSLSAD